MQNKVVQRLARRGNNKIKLLFEEAKLRCIQMIYGDAIFVVSPVQMNTSPNSQNRNCFNRQPHFFLDSKIRNEILLS